MFRSAIHHSIWGTPFSSAAPASNFARLRGDRPVLTEVGAGLRCRASIKWGRDRVPQAIPYSANSTRRSPAQEPETGQRVYPVLSESLQNGYMKNHRTLSITVLMLLAMAAVPVQAQVELRQGGVSLERGVESGSSLQHRSGASDCQVGQVLSPGESCTVGSQTFQVLSDGSGRFGGITAGTSTTFNDFKPSRISRTNNWRIDAVPGSVSSEFVDIQYDQGEAVGAGGERLLFARVPEQVIVATRFAPKTDSGDDRDVRLKKIWFAPYFENQFGDSSLPESSPRDLIVFIYADQEGAPGAELFSKEFSDTRAFDVARLTLKFLELDLSNEGIGTLPDVVHIAFGNAGSDRNYLNLGPAPYTKENVSHVYPIRVGWEPLWDVTTDTGLSYWGTVIPIRARFLLGGTSVSVEQGILPEALVVHGNYPNPFRQETRLEFDLPLPARVAVEIFDITGRRVLTVPPSDMAAGWQHHITVDGRSLPPGHYMYQMAVSSAEGTSLQTGHLVRVR